MRKSQVNLVYLVFALLFALLYFSKNSGRFFWLDEITTLNIARSPTFLDVIFQAKNETIQPPLFYLMGRIWAKVSLKPEWLRSLPLICYLGILFILIKNIKYSLLAYLALIFYFFSAAEMFTTYLMTEFRPYSLSLLLFTLIFHLFLNFKETDRYFYIKTSTALVLFSCTLSLNIPLGLGLIVLLIVFFYFKSYKLSTSSSIISIFSLTFSFLAVAFLLFYIKSNSNLLGNFELSPYLEALEKNSTLVLSEIITLPGAFIFLLLISLAFNKNTLNGRNLFFGSILFLIFIFSIVFPTFILHNRIPWYSARYSHIAYLVIPFYVILLSKQLNPIFKYSRRPHQILGLLLFLLGGMILQILAKPSLTSINGINSLWAEIENAKYCEKSNSMIITNPDYIDRVGSYHLELSKFPKQAIVGVSDIDKIVGTKKCIVLINSNHAEFDDIQTFIIKHGYILKHSFHPHQDSPQNIDNYKIFIL